MTVEEMDQLLGRTNRDLLESRKTLNILLIRAREMADSHERIAALLRESPERAGEMAELDQRLQADLPLSVLTNLARETAAMRHRVIELEDRQRLLQ
jgi:hypothetical protein